MLLSFPASAAPCLLVPRAAFSLAARMVSHRSRRCQTLCRFLFSENSARIHLGPLAITSKQLLSCLALAREALPTLEQYSPFRKGWERHRRRQSCWLPPSPPPPHPQAHFFWVSFSTGGPAAGLGSRAGPHCGTRGSQQPFGEATSKCDQRSGRAARAEGGRLLRAVPRKHNVRLRDSPHPAT